ncbi:hypothetical protein D8674_020877 [Pyrus ussuriensis x Pyrus communis]|uniref:Uncharacterized protein n=1 Tax=Pyrus ussuriensis x Pyrus communis TaxID=2448454 RepID=A0A5N5HGX6_9ROSA|nr:hypothetical protein D8674_020877 [Pyrus ussuriensis x Pyrus communis]
MKLKAMMQKDGGSGRPRRSKSPRCSDKPTGFTQHWGKEIFQLLFYKAEGLYRRRCAIDSGRKQLCARWASGQRLRPTLQGDRFSYIPRARTPVSPGSTVARRQGPTKPLKRIHTSRRLSTS